MNSLASITKRTEPWVRPLLIVIVNFLMLQPALAQQNSKETPQPPTTTVTLTITADLEPTGEHIPRLPTDVVERLSEQDALANFELRAAESSRVRLNARYLFPGIDALTSWQESEETQGLMQLLDAPGGREYTVSVRRHQVQQSLYLSKSHNEIPAPAVDIMAVSKSSRLLELLNRAPHLTVHI